MNSMHLHLKSLCLLIFLTISVGAGFAQDCEPLTRDSITDPGAYEVATLTEGDGIRNGPGYAGATIYYPTNGTPPYACIAIVPGFVSLESSIEEWGPFYASHGIVAMTIGTNDLFDFPDVRATALLDAIVTLTEENSRTGSPLMGNIDVDRMAVSGWSMGGGGAQLAAAADPTLKAVVALCPWLDFGITADALDHPVPALIFSGENDDVAPPSQHANNHYAFTPETTSKLLFEVDNGSHNVANFPTGGDGYVGKIALSWLKLHLMNDSCYCPLIPDTPPTASHYETNVVCENNPTSIFENAEAHNSLYQLYPNPSSESINLKIERLDVRTSYEVISVTGMKVSSGVVTSAITNINTQSLAPGIYYLNVLTALHSERIKFMVH